MALRFPPLFPSHTKLCTLINRFVELLRYTFHIFLCMTPAVMFSKHPVMPLFFGSSPLSQIIYIPHTPSIYFPRSVFSSHWCIICAHQCCFSAWFSSSSAWMHSYQIKLALTDSDLPAPPQHIPPHTRIPGVPSLHHHLSFYPSFDISAAFCHLRVPAEC